MVKPSVPCRYTCNYSRQQSSGNRCAFCKNWYGSKWSSWNASKTLVWGSPITGAILCELLVGSPSTAAIMTSSMAGIYTVHVMYLYIYMHSQVLQVLHFMSHGDTAAIGKILQHLGDIHQNSVVWVPAQQYQHEYYRHWGWRACHGIHHVCIPYAKWNMECIINSGSSQTLNARVCR
jgi:hypothetical protein